VSSGDDGYTTDLLLRNGRILLEGGVPDERDAVTVPGAELLNDDREVVGLRCMLVSGRGYRSEGKLTCSC
jgi:hypothetical protein